MRLTGKHVAKYQAIYLATFGKPVSKEDALVQGLALLRLVRNITQPEPTNNYMEYKNETKPAKTL